MLINIFWFEITEPGGSNCGAPGSVFLRSFVVVQSVVVEGLVVQLLSLF